MASNGESTPSRPPRGLARAWILVAIVTAAAGFECNGAGRFPICKSNAECSESTTGRVCYNLKCVACRYDSDCQSGFTCGGSNECTRISETGEPEDAGSSEGKGEGGNKGEGWEYGTWDQCAADCKDRDCIKKCDQKFQK